MTFVSTLLKYINQVGIRSIRKVIKNFRFFSNCHLGIHQSCDMNTRDGYVKIMYKVIKYHQREGKILTSEQAELYLILTNHGFAKIH